MAIQRIRSRYKHLVEKLGPPRPDGESAEQSLDTLLRAHQQRSAREQAPSSTSAGGSRLEVFRRRLCEELIPAFEEVKQKYTEQGIKLNMDASDFLEGGRKLVIESSWQSQTLRLDGTVTDAGIAFNEIRSVGGVDGAICSGPMLRIHRLTSDNFREFICTRVAVLVRSVLRLKR